jgi:hypothetical protein
MAARVTFNVITNWPTRATRPVRQSLRCRARDVRPRLLGRSILVRETSAEYTPAGGINALDV